MFYERKIALAIWRVFPPVWLVLGTLGNLLTIIVLMQRKNRNSSISKYLIALAVSDIAVLWTALPRNWLDFGYGFDIRSESSIVCKVQLYLLFLGTNCSVWFIVIFTIERFISTWLPLKAKGICTSKNANIVIFSVFIFLVLVNIHFLYGMGHPKGNLCYPKDEDYANFIFNIWAVIKPILFTLFPVAILVIMNLSIIFRLLMMRRKSRTRVLPHEMSTAARERKEKSRQATAMLITLNVVFMICVIPIVVFLMIYSDWVLSHGNDHSDAVLELIYAIINAFYFTNNAVNFILYFLSGSTFRKEAKELFSKLMDKFSLTCRRNAHLGQRNVNNYPAQENLELQNV